MTEPITQEEGLRALRQGFERYCPLDEETWNGLQEISSLVEYPKDGFLSRQGEVPSSFGFVCHGLLRGFSSNESGHQYNKVFFKEGTFPGSMIALLTNTPSAIAIQALEPSSVMRIHFRAYRRLLEQRSDLKWFQILYLEQNWLLAKEPREVALVQKNATQRYLDFLRDHPDLEKRLPQYHLASHLGVTPTQLSRIRRDLADHD